MSLSWSYVYLLPMPKRRKPPDSAVLSSDRKSAEGVGTGVVTDRPAPAGLEVLRAQLGLTLAVVGEEAAAPPARTVTTGGRGWVGGLLPLVYRPPSHLWSVTFGLFKGTCSRRAAVTRVLMFVPKLALLLSDWPLLFTLIPTATLSIF